MKRTLGVCYYPEHWPEAQWAEDAARMARLGLTWVRIGEFAWSRMEPEPGGDITIQIRVMHHMEPPEEGYGVEQHMLQIEHEI